MTEKITLHLDDIMEAEDNLQTAAAGLLSEVKIIKEENDPEILKRYYKNFEKMTFLIKNYADFLIEDTDLIYQAVLSILELDGRMSS